uniref:Death domain-containing protein n=1 Tax=Branchiostoma floridae TaxID=7739 RepID=C3YP91_BRAFL|eukprot:XP_002601970.1 hypothetical protein BRAFLDRAFT_94541 [Branchiostoma floridae]
MESDFVQEKTGHRCKVCRLSVRGHPGPYGRGKCKFERREGSSDEEYFKQQRGSAHVEEKLRSLRRDSKVSDLVRAVWSDSISMDTDETQVRQSSSHNLKKSSGYSRENASTRARSESPAVQFSRHRARNVSTSREAGPARPEKPDIRDLRKSRALVRKVDKALDELLDSDTSRGKQPRSKRYEDRGSVSSLSQSDSTESDFMRKLRRRQRRRGSRGKSCKMKGERVSSKLFISRRRWDSYDSDTSGPLVVLLHAAQDGEFVRRLVEKLRDLGAGYSLPQTDIPCQQVTGTPGDVSRAQLTSTLTHGSVKLVVPVISRHLLADQSSLTVGLETAVRNNKPRYVIWLDQNKDDFREFGTLVSRQYPTLEAPARRVQRDRIEKTMPGSGFSWMDGIAWDVRDALCRQTGVLRWPCLTALDLTRSFLADNMNLPAVLARLEQENQLSPAAVRDIQVSRAVGEERQLWTRLGQELGLNRTVLDNIRRDYYFGNTKMAFQMLKAWRTKTPHGPLHYLPQLEETLQNMGKPDLAAAVQGVYKEYCDALPLQEVSPEMTGDTLWSLRLPGEGKYLCRRTDLGMVTPYPLCHTCEGKYLCRRTDLGVVTSYPLHVTYRSANWSDNWQQVGEWMPLGPLFSIQCEDVEGPVDILLPHVLCLTDVSELTPADIQVVHVVGDSPELLPVTELTPSHAVTRFKKGSLFGVVGRTAKVLGISRNGLLTAFAAVNDSDISTLKVYIVSNTTIMHECLMFEDTFDTNKFYEPFRVEVTSDIWNSSTTSRLTLELLKEVNNDAKEPVAELTLGHYKRGNTAEGVDSGLSTPTELEKYLESLDIAGRGSILLVGDEYCTSKGGISTINRQVAHMITAAGAKVYATVLEASQQEERDAERDGVRLLKPRLDVDSSAKPSLEWLTVYHKHHFPHIPSDISCIVGHVDVTSRAARKIKEERFPHAKLVMFGHVAPEETEHYKSDEKALGVGRKEASIQDDIGKADVVFSVGPRIHRHYDRFLHQCGVDHYIFLPEPSKVFSEAKMTFGEEDEAEKPERVVLSIGRVRNVEMLKEKWADAIEDFITNARSEFAEARAFREKLLASKYWEESHQTFLQASGITASPSAQAEGGDAEAGDPN